MTVYNKKYRLLALKLTTMLKAIFLDLDETLCDTTAANQQALAIMAQQVKTLLGNNIDEQAFAQAYLKGIYRELNDRYQQLLLPIIDEQTFRLKLIELILSDMQISPISPNDITILQTTFDEARTKHFQFFKGIKELLIELRQSYTLVVITNGPTFSQLTKVNAVKLYDFVDHIIIGGQEKEQKPAVSIFTKALQLCQCNKNEVIHIGDSLSADIKGANDSGICSVWISHSQDLDETLNITPTHIIETPFQIKDIINTLDNNKRHQQ